ncbi:DNA-binding transcriptional regulator of glucitol operon [Saccharopolyspora hordei]|uniref:DNA-binding transcriptional regulator of glucitol operon n=1 Tax=Saccharopolyspora hordei TaxID=1838 RepID=A0A853ASN3_9PSEU|nr:DNA-binding transcriptional regulator of glucitol operon [Saccharopolyspora hordei]
MWAWLLVETVIAWALAASAVGWIRRGRRGGCTGS